MKLGEVIRKYRRSSDIGIRGMAKELGISIATLSRLENNKDVTGSTITKILVWLFNK